MDSDFLVLKNLVLWIGLALLVVWEECFYPFPGRSFNAWDNEFFEWKICFDEDFGCIVNSALRYAIGRHTYMPGVVRNFIRKYMTVLDAKTLVIAIRDIDSELRIGELDEADEWSLLRSELQARLDEMQENTRKE